MPTLRQAVRFALRSLRAAPGHVLGVVLLMALGIGATTAAFSALRGILWTPLPFPHADRLVVPVSVSPADDIRRGGVTFADYRDWSSMADVLDHVALYQELELDLTGGGEPESVRVDRVTPEFFATLDLRPVIGRDFTASDAVPGAPQVALLARALWQRRFGGDPNVVGRTVRLSGIATEILGVMPEEASFRRRALAWLPAQEDPGAADNLRRDNMVWGGVARLRPGVSIEQARSRVQALAAALARDQPAVRRGITNDLLPLRRAYTSESTRRATLVLFAAVVATLLVACVNVAGLLLARATVRQREIAVRRALGASRRQLVGHLLTESLVVALAGGALGVLVAQVVLKAAPSLVPGDVLPPGGLELGIDPLALGFALAASCVAAVLSGLVPAWIATSDRSAASLRVGVGTLVRRRTYLTRSALVAAQVGVSCTVLLAASLLVHSFSRLVAADPGARTGQVLTAGLRLPVGRYPSGAPVAEFYARLLLQVGRLPGVESAAAVSRVPVGGPGLQLGRSFLSQGAPEPPSGHEYHAEWSVVTPGYFRTMSIPLLAGRSFDERDIADAEPVAVLSEALARRMFPGGDPIGQRIRSWRDENVLRRVVGVARDVRYFGAADEWSPLVYVPHSQSSWRGMRLVVRTSGDPLALAGALRRTVAQADPELPLTELDSADRYRLGSMAGLRLAASLLGGFGLLAVALTAAGVFGLTAYTVAMRRREFGLRMALGARRSDLLSLVLGRAGRLAALGIVAGLAAALAARRFLVDLLFETPVTDAVPLLAVPLLLALVTLLASYLPAKRIADVDPSSVLRAE